ncbi:MAG TPA: serine hydrolase [Blastocatellia bacterium]|nr:serine hydrolase [Blastocatellia bacterium]
MRRGNPIGLNIQTATLLLSAFVLSFVVTGTRAQTTTTLTQLQPKLEQLIVASGADTVSIAVYDLQSKQSLHLNDKVSLHAASTMKVPVMMELFRQVAQQQLSLDATITVKNEFASIVDGSPYQLTPGDDSDNLMYQKIGQPMSVRALIKRMIVRSSNLATNILIEKAQAQNVMQLMRQLGANDIQVRRGVEDTKAFRAGLNNTTTAYDLLVLLRAIAERKFVNARACDEMRDILLQQEFNEGIPALLPAGTKVAHKTGSITKIYHDAGIVYPPKRKPYVIVVLTRGIAEEKRAHQLVAQVSHAVYQALQ